MKKYINYVFLEYKILFIIINILFVGSCTMSGINTTSNITSKVTISPDINVNETTELLSTKEISTANNDLDPTETPIVVIHENILICEEEKLKIVQQIDHNWNFYYLDLDCRQNLENCNITLNHYFTFEYHIKFKELIQQFIRNDSELLYISYDVIDNYKSNLFQYNIVDNEIQQITNDDETAFARKSDDGTLYIIFDNLSNLYLLDENGNKVIYSTDIIFSTFPSLSPDNKWMIFAGEYKENTNFGLSTELFLLDVSDPGKIENLDNVIAGEVSYANSMGTNQIVWMDDSKSFIYTGKIDGLDIICTYNIESFGKKCFYQHKFQEIADYKLNNNRLIIEGIMSKFDLDNCGDDCTDESTNIDIFLLDLKTGDLHSVTTTKSSEIDPMWLESGLYILYSKYINSYWQVFLTDPYGSFHEQITFSENNHYLNGMCPGY
ncbi:MAG: hypothetical protein JEZ00_19545 [Anaerolineaceae bacterium]|nr:hypothetical protein [Anaerolineaceae bacterium]